MATSNVNKIVRGNLNLKPWILNKNPAGIVNSYVQQLYKQVPDSYKKDLFKPRNNVPPVQPPAEKRPTPFRFTVPIVNQAKKTLRPNVWRSSQITMNNNFVSAPKKFLKSPNFKIYNSRQYSSASSSGASFYRCDFEERRKQLYKPASGVQHRTYSGTVATSGSKFFNSPSNAKYIGPTRVFNDVSQHVKCLNITNAICKDLMSVDKILKEKIRLVKTKPSSLDAKLSKQELLQNSLRGWNHPTLANLNKIHLPVSGTQQLVSVPVSPNRRSSAYNMLQAGKNQKANISKTTIQTIMPRTPRRENARHEAVPCVYMGFSARSYDARKSEEQNKNQQQSQKGQQQGEQQQQPPQQQPQQQKKKKKYTDSGNDSGERVCRSRTDRERNPRSLRMNQRKVSTAAQLLRRY